MKKVLYLAIVTSILACSKYDEIPKVIEKNPVEIDRISATGEKKYDSNYSLEKIMTINVWFKSYEKVMFLKQENLDEVSCGSGNLNTKIQKKILSREDEYSDYYILYPDTVSKISIIITFSNVENYTDCYCELQNFYFKNNYNNLIKIPKSFFAEKL